MLGRNRNTGSRQGSADMGLRLLGRKKPDSPSEVTCKAMGASAVKEEDGAAIRAGDKVGGFHLSKC